MKNTLTTRKRVHGIENDNLISCHFENDNLLRCHVGCCKMVCCVELLFVSNLFSNIACVLSKCCLFFFLKKNLVGWLIVFPSIVMWLDTDRNCEYTAWT